ncbi:MAG TPA: hypothetical protein VM901_09135 [Bdellovibrionota bacterium]|jgi:hypothetical protein|nr:hypothetical protein [Bdellovibrionota bacterium]
MIGLMHVWVLSDESVYGSLKVVLEREGGDRAVREESHSLGFRSLELLRAGERVGGVLLVPVSDQIIFQGIQWAHKTWQVSDFINFDALTSLDPTLTEGRDYMVAVPKRCLRSAGRGDLQQGPLLYEEMAFSESVQMMMAQWMNDDSASLIDPQLNVFSGFGLDHDAAFEHTISQNVKCFGWDNTTGEVLRSARRLAVRAGALYVISARHEYRLGALDAFLKAHRGKWIGN